MAVLAPTAGAASAIAAVVVGVVFVSAGGVRTVAFRFQIMPALVVVVHRIIVLV